MKSYILFVNTVLGGGDNVQSSSSLFELESGKSSAHENSYDELEVSGRLHHSLFREHSLFLSKSYPWELFH